MPFLIPAAIAVFSAVETAVGTALMFIPGMTIGGALATSSFLVETGLAMGLNMALGAIEGGPGSQTAGPRQASVVQMVYGEDARVAIFGVAARGGQLLKAFNHGGDFGTDWETLIIRLADHECDALEGVWVNDQFVPYLGDGMVGGYNDQLQWYWLPGTAGQTLPSYVYDAAPNGGGWAADNKMTGLAGLVVSYKADKGDAQSPVWPGGRPSFLPVIRGKKCYDPRKDSSIGGSGAHRWADPTTWEWTENAYICRYNWARGVFALDQVDQPDQLLVGRGFSIFQAPPERAFAPANLCDEDVAKPDLSTEKRYRVGGVIKSSDEFATVEQWFADAMAGQIIQPQGGVEVEPGQSKVPVATITDADLITGAALEFNRFGSGANRVNTVVPSYVEPTQKWQTTSGTTQRDYSDVLADGKPLVETLALPLVTSRTQAERIAAVRRRQRRLERAGKNVLGPRFSHLEDGDWITWTSAANTNNAAVTFVVQSYALGGDWRNALLLAETSDAVYDAADHFYESPDLIYQPPPDAVALGHVTATPILINGTDGSAIPAVRFTWDEPVDAAIIRIRAEVRPALGTDVSPTLIANVNDGVAVVVNGVASSRPIEARLVPVAPGRAIVPSDWIAMDIGALVGGDTATVAGVPAATIVSDISTNAEELAKEILRGEARDAFDAAMSYLAGQPLATIVQDIRDQGDGYADAFTLLGVKNGGGTAWILAGGTIYMPDGATLLEDYVTAVSATLGSVSASVTVLESVTTGPGGLTSKWAVHVDSDGHVAGIELLADGTTTQFYVVADQFGFIDPGDGSAPATVPFSYAAGVLRMYSVEVNTVAANTITTNHLVDHSVTQSVVDVVGQTFGTGIASYLLVGSCTVTVAEAGQFMIEASWTQAQDGTHLLWKFDIKLDGTSISNGSFNEALGLCTRPYAEGLAAGTHTVDLYWAGPTSTFIDQVVTSVVALKK